LKSPDKARNRHKQIRGEVIIVAKSQDYFRGILTLASQSLANEVLTKRQEEEKPAVAASPQGRTCSRHVPLAIEKQDSMQQGVSRHERPDL
jgi:hypothetical protein